MDEGIMREKIPYSTLPRANRNHILTTMGAVKILHDKDGVLIIQDLNFPHCTYKWNRLLGSDWYEMTERKENGK
jgi:hypothetical protein